MGLFEVNIKVSHDCPFCNLSGEFPSAKMFTWCNGEYDIIEVIFDNDEDQTELFEKLSTYGKFVEKSSKSMRFHLLTRKCACVNKNSVTEKIEACNILKIPPDIYKQGWEYYRLISFRNEDIVAFCKMLEQSKFKFEILRKIPFEGSISSSLTFTADTLLAGLTQKQMDALLTAFNQGYYGVPRRADIKTIANRKNVPRTTFTEHLRKAETKILTGLMPYIQLFNKTSSKNRSLIVD